MPFTPVTFSPGAILKQLKDDLWCKEIATGYTVSYTWCANQLGHFTIGFAPTLLFGVMLLITPWPWLAPLAALLPVALLAIKEWGDIGSEQDRYRKIPGVAGLDLVGVCQDAGTACWFCLVGALVGAAVFIAPALPRWIAWQFPLLVLLALCLPSALVMRYWLVRKMCFQRAGLPFTFRLSYFSRRQIAGDLAAAQQRLADFQAGAIEHLIIAGPAKAGKTSLAVALGTELGFRRITVRYIDCTDFMDEARNGEAAPVHIAYVLWPWTAADVLIIDDVGDGQSMGQVLRLTGPAYATAMQTLPRKKIVWVIEEPDQLAAFAGMLAMVFPGGRIAGTAVQAEATAETAKALEAWRRPAGR